MSTKTPLRMVQTCPACPEQYDVYLGDEQVGYLRLRWGVFTAEYYGKQVYEARPDGQGSFEDYERDHHLDEAKQAIVKELRKKKGPAK